MSIRDKLNLFNPEVPVERGSTIPSVWYLDSDIYELERKTLFLNSWQKVARLSQLSEKGDYVTFDLAGEPLLLVRDQEDTLRAFSNVCRHRAARICTSECGKSSYFQCRYHGWTYDLRGRLKGAPEFDGVANFFKEENNLPEWNVETWGDSVFVHGGKFPLPLGETLFPMPERTAALNMGQLKFVKRTEYEMKCNWKLFVDNYLDGGYHINTVHPSLAGMIDYSQYRTEIARQTSVQVSPMRATPKDADLKTLRAGDSAYYWWIYPNLMLNIYDGIMDINIVYPTAPDRCRVVFEYYFANPNWEGVEKSLDLSHQIQLEDMAVCEEVQRNLASRSFQTGRFSVKRETGVHHFHQLLATDLQNASH